MGNDERAAMMILARGLTSSQRRYLREALARFAEGAEDTDDDAGSREIARALLAEMRHRDQFSREYGNARTDEERERVLQREEQSHRTAVESGVFRPRSRSLSARLKTREVRARRKRERQGSDN